MKFIEYLKESLKVTDNLIKIDNDILMTKNESYINTKNRHHVIRNDTLIITTNCIKLKSMIRENVKSLKNIKNNLYSVKKDSDSIQIDLKKLKEQSINNFNKRAKIWPIIIAKIKTYSFNKKIRAQPIINTKIKTNKASSKNNAACTIKDSGIVYACTSTDDVCTNENEPCTNENENETEPCTNNDDDDEDEDEDEDYDDKDEDDDDDNSDIDKLQKYSVIKY